ALCNAHHLRELTFLEEELSEKWAGKMKSLLREIKCEVEKARDKGKAELDESEIKEFENRYEKILKQGQARERKKPALATGKRGRKKQSKSKNLLDRLSRYRKETLAFMYDFRVPFDNNLAERDLRMMKVQQKISGSFRTEEGAKIFCRIRSYVSTMRKQGHNVLTVLKSVFTGHPIAPALRG
ncbi:MAG: IS66 family transposase, partial [Thermodesulfobacteriota bacterium]